jgi:hypothetical protein
MAARVAAIVSWCMMSGMEGALNQRRAGAA